MSEIKLNRRYPDSKTEDITDAYMRGFEVGRAMRTDENEKLRELVQDMYACIEALCSMVENSPGCSMCPTNQDEEKPCAAADVYCRMRELGVEA